MKTLSPNRRIQKLIDGLEDQGYIAWIAREKKKVEGETVYSVVIEETWGGVFYLEDLEVCIEEITEYNTDHLKRSVVKSAFFSSLEVKREGFNCEDSNYIKCWFTCQAIAYGV